MLPVRYSIDEVSAMLAEFFSWHWLPQKWKPMTRLTVYVHRNIHRSYNFFFDDDKLGLSGQQKLSIKMIFKVVKKQAWRDDELCLKFRWDSSSLFISKSMARQILSKSKHLFMVEKPKRRPEILTLVVLPPSPPELRPHWLFHMTCKLVVD